MGMGWGQKDWDDNQTQTMRRLQYDQTILTHGPTKKRETGIAAYTYDIGSSDELVIDSCLRNLCPCSIVSRRRRCPWQFM